MNLGPDKMKRLSFITIHPEFVYSYLGFGVFASALKQKIAEFNVINLRDFAVDKHGSVDSRAYGGGDGMIMRPEPLANAVESIKSPSSLVLFPSPHGKSWNHHEAQSFADSSCDHLIFICGRFGGVDQRFIDLYVDYQFSMGDFVLSGGELPSLSLADSMLRLVPKVLGHAESGDNDSFGEGMGGLLEHPQYTRPLEFKGVQVPAVLTGGNHRLINNWKELQSREVTSKLRPDLLASRGSD